MVRSLGQEPRPPFPKGHTLEQGDWSLLDRVRGRPKMWRDVPLRGGAHKKSRIVRNLSNGMIVSVTH